MDPHATQQSTEFDTYTYTYTFLHTSTSRTSSWTSSICPTWCMRRHSSSSSTSTYDAYYATNIQCHSTADTTCETKTCSKKVCSRKTPSLRRPLIRATAPDFEDRIQRQVDSRMDQLQSKTREMLDNITKSLQQPTSSVPAPQHRSTIRPITTYGRPG